MSRNSEYEARQKSKGLRKVTLWVPCHCENEFRLMAQSCCEDKDLIPFMLRSLSTGQMRKGS
nr:FpsC [Expression vector SW2]APZ74272.1 FpsC [Expression_vector_SW4]